ncbi:Helix-turn-helix domain protein [compost metagenome]
MIYFKKIIIQCPRTPDELHYLAFKEQYLEEAQLMLVEQQQFDPIKWINAELDFIDVSRLIPKNDFEDKYKVNSTVLPAKVLITNKEILTLNDMLEMFNISKSTLDRRRKEGLPFSKVAKKLFFNKTEVNKWIEKHHW